MVRPQHSKEVKPWEVIFDPVPHRPFFSHLTSRHTDCVVVRSQCSAVSDHSCPFSCAGLWRLLRLLLLSPDNRRRTDLAAHCWIHWHHPQKGMCVCWDWHYYTFFVRGFILESLCLSVHLSVCHSVRVFEFVTATSPEPHLLWCCIIMRWSVVQKNWFTVKVTARAHIIKIWLFLL